MSVKEVFALSVTICALIAAGCVGALNSSPPDYIKDVVATTEGDGYVVYFILADKSGEMTTSDGLAVLQIEDARRILYTRQVQVSKSDFVKAKVGLGAFQHDAILYSFGRIPVSTFASKPSGLTGTVSLTFKATGKTMSGEKTIFF